MLLPWFYVGKDTTKQEELLRQSINEYPNHSNNYHDLSKFMYRPKQVSEAKISEKKL